MTWKVLSSEFFAVLGAAVALYALYIEWRKEMDEGYEALCDTASFSCTKVLMSEYGHILSKWGLVAQGSRFDVPNPVLGLGFYGLVLARGALGLPRQLMLAAATAIGAAAEDLTVVSFGGAYQEGQSKALFQPAGKALGINVKEETYTGIADLRLKVKAGAVTWDVVASGSGSAARAGAAPFDPRSQSARLPPASRSKTSAKGKRAPAASSAA